MLTWDDEVKPSTPTNLARTAAVNAPLVQESSYLLPAHTGRWRNSSPNPLLALHPRRGPASCALPTSASSTDKTDVNQLVPSIQVGVGKVPQLAPTTDAAGSEHDPRHRALKDPNGLTEDERRIVKRNLAFL